MTTETTAAPAVAPPIWNNRRIHNLIKATELEGCGGLALGDGAPVGQDRRGRKGYLSKLDTGRYAVSFGYAREEEKFSTLADVAGFIWREGMIQ